MGGGRAAQEALRPHSHHFANPLHAFIAHVRIKGRAFQISLGVPEAAIAGEGARTGSDDILLACVNKAGWLLEHIQDEPADEGTPNQRAASTHKLVKRTGRPAGPSSGSAAASAPTPAPRQEAAAQNISLREASAKSIQHMWRRRKGRFTSRGTAIMPAKKCAIMEVRFLLSPRACTTTFGNSLVDNTPSQHTTHL